MQFEEAIQYFGNISATARALTVSRQCVDRWGSQRKIPLVHQHRIEKLSNGRLIADEYGEQKAPGQTAHMTVFIEEYGECIVKNIVCAKNRVKINYSVMVGGEVKLFVLFADEHTKLNVLEGAPVEHR